jgi:hypothetical protein
VGFFDKPQAAQQAPAAPDTSAISNAQQATAQASTQNATDALNWAKGANIANTATADTAVSGSLAAQNQLNNASTTDRSQYENSMYPALQQEKNDAATYASAGKKDLDIGAAQSGVAQQFDAARNNSTQALEAYGVNPASTRFAALDIGTRASQAAAQAAAGTTASNNVDATARALNHQVVTDSAPLANQATNEATAGVGAGTSAVGQGTTATQTGASTMGTGTQWAGVANTANSGAAATQLGTAGVANDATKINNAAADQNNKTSSGIGSAIGTAVGVGSMFLAKGGAVDPGDATPGGAVPVHASPTGGRAVDDVKANLTVGEYIVPKDVVAWKGQEHFQKLIDSSRKQASEATAKPSVGPAIGGPAAVQSRPQGAIPMSRAA